VKIGRLVAVAGLCALMGLGTALLATSTVGAQELSYTDLVRDIEVEGNQRIEPETIRSYMTIRIGDPFDPGLIDRSLKSLFATGLFADVVLRREGSALVVRVVENPIINRVAFEGNDKFEDDSLEAEVQLRPRMVYTRTRVQNDVQRIIELYRRTGRFAATVEPKVIRLSDNRVDLVFEIDDGPITEVRKIAFVGNEKYTDGELREVVQTRESKWWRFLTSADVYDPDAITFDRELLRRFYLSHGYADFRVMSAVAELTRDREAFFITLTIEEGARYRFGRVDVESQLRDLSSAQLLPHLTTEPGDWYNADKVESTIQKLTDEVGNLGYAFVDIQPDVNPDRDRRTIDVTYRVNEGPRVYVQRIDISGNSRTLDEVIRREFRFVEGDAFNTAKFRRSKQRIENLAFFSAVELEPLPGDAPDQTIIKVNVAEQATGTINLGGGFSTFEGLLTDFGIRENNLLGRGQVLRLNASISTRRQLIDLGFTEPYLFSRDLAGSADIFRRTTDFRRESSFDQEELGFNTSVGYSITEELRHSVRYVIRRDLIEGVNDDASRFIKEQEGATVISAVGHTFALERRDSRVFPREGYYLSFSQDLAGFGGSEKFFRNEFNYEYYYPLSEQWIASFTFTEGFIFGLAGEDVPISERFFLGGSSMRGFDSSGVGPRDQTTGDALGGNLRYVASLGVTFPVGLPAEFPVRGSVFTDIGSLSGIDDKDPVIFDKGSPRVGVGIGFNYVSPFGPVGFEVTKAVVKEDVDEEELFRINFGTTF
jgi:outer membrane protein insertion porin family